MAARLLRDDDLMRKYQVIENHVEIGAGRVMLDADQFKARSHNLRAIGPDGVCEIVKPVQFKLGEVFGFDGDLGKHMRQFVIEAALEPDAKPDKKVAK